MKHVHSAVAFAAIALVLGFASGCGQTGKGASEMPDGTKRASGMLMDNDIPKAARVPRDKAGRIGPIPDEPRR